MNTASPRFGLYEVGTYVSVHVGARSSLMAQDAPSLLIGFGGGEVVRARGDACHTGQLAHGHWTTNMDQSLLLT